MKRIILEVVLGLIAVGLGIFCFLQFGNISELKKQLGEVAQFQEESNKLKQELQDNAVELNQLRVKGRILDASRYALSSGIALIDIQAAADAVDALDVAAAPLNSPPVEDGAPQQKAKSKGMNADRLLATGALRMLIYGESDQKALDAFEKALEMVDLKSKLKAVCAAQAGIAASGKDIDILSECQIKP